MFFLFLDLFWGRIMFMLQLTTEISFPLSHLFVHALLLKTNSYTHITSVGTLSV
jgi:hypothetical protein